jgi:hypothetical protein
VKIFSLSVTVIILLSGCSANNSKKNTGQGEKNDSTVSAGVTDLSSTKSIYTLLCQDWDYKDDADELDSSNGVPDLDMPYRGFSFFPDSTVVKDPRQYILFGNWVYNDADKTIAIKYDNGKTEKYKIMKIGPKDLTLIKNDDKKDKLVFIADGKQEQSYSDDPFYIANNQWRIKPGQPESDDAIKEKLRQCIRFYILYFNDNIKRHSTAISFYGLPSCFNWYAGGISVQSEEKLKGSWTNIFYNDNEAIKAHGIMENLITKNYNWDTTETNWVKQSAPVLQQMYDSLK